MIAPGRFEVDIPISRNCSIDCKFILISRIEMIPILFVAILQPSSHKSTGKNCLVFRANYISSHIFKLPLGYSSTSLSGFINKNFVEVVLKVEHITHFGKKFVNTWTEGCYCLLAVADRPAVNIGARG